MYANGEGVPPDHAEASKWYRMAADQGIPQSQNNLASNYHNGEGVPQDYVEAYVWFSLAIARYPASEGRDNAVKGRDLSAAKMTPAQIAEAQKRIRDWKPK
jgi:TPR repeat protein